MFVVNYTGPFGFIKPWTALRDSETYSQQFLTQSMLAGIERKLFPELLNKDYALYKIKRHRLNYKMISQQQEQIQPRGWNKKGKKNNVSYERPYAILVRGVLINPSLSLCFESEEDANCAASQHICLARNEDILYPSEEVIEISEEEFDANEEDFPGFELMFERTDKSFLVGYNRLNNNEAMYGWLKVVGNPVTRNY